MLLARDTFGGTVETVLEPSPDTFGAADLSVLLDARPLHRLRRRRQPRLAALRRPSTRQRRRQRLQPPRPQRADRRRSSRWRRDEHLARLRPGGARPAAARRSTAPLLDGGAARAARRHLARRPRPGAQRLARRPDRHHERDQPARRPRRALRPHPLAEPLRPRSASTGRTSESVTGFAGGEEHEHRPAAGAARRPHLGPAPTASAASRCVDAAAAPGPRRRRRRHRRRGAGGRRARLHRREPHRSRGCSGSAPAPGRSTLEAIGQLARRRAAELRALRARRRHHRPRLRAGQHLRRQRLGRPGRAAPPARRRRSAAAEAAELYAFGDYGRAYDRSTDRDGDARARRSARSASAPASTCGPG